MPSSTTKQKRFMSMSATASGRKRLKSRGVRPAPIKVAKEFIEADKRK